MVKISVIIPTRNRAKYLQSTLDSIVKQKINNDLCEVIVIDNGSTDNTSAIIESFKPLFNNFKHIYSEIPGLHVGRHTGLKASSSELLVFVDDDIEAFPNWLNCIIDSFNDPSVAMVGGKVLPLYEETPPDFICEMWNREFKGGHLLGFLSILDFGNEIKEIDPHFVFGCNFAIRKSVLLSSGGFHPDGVPQEYIKYRGDGETYVSDYIVKNNLKTIYNPDASVYHKVPKERLTLNYFKKRAFNQGVSDSYTTVRSTGGRKSVLIKNIAKKSIYALYNYLFQKKKISGQLNLASLKGFLFHHYHCFTDKDLLCYVLRENYLENYEFK